MKQDEGDSWATVVAFLAIGIPLGLIDAYLFAFELDPGSSSIAFGAAALGVLSLTCLIGAIVVAVQLTRRGHKS